MPSRPTETAARLALPPMPHALRAAAETLFGAGTLPPGANPGLVWSRYPRLWQSRGGAPELPRNEDRQVFLTRFCEDFKGSEARLAPLVQANHRRLAQLGEARSYVTYARLVTGLGQAHPSENGFAFDPLLGVPWLPGSGLAGLTRATARCLGEPPEDIRRLLGSEAPGRDHPGAATQPGRIVFLGGWPEPHPWPALAVDLISPHHPEYQRDQARGPGGRRGLPRLAHYTDEPKPVAFLTLETGAHLRLYLAPRAGASPADLDRVWRWLTVGLNMLGLGGKTASGYGRMRMPTDPNPRPAPVQRANKAVLDPREIADRLIELDFADRRALLLSGLPIGFVASLPFTTRADDQVRLDLDRLAGTPELVGFDGTPLVHVLRNAARVLHSEHRPGGAELEGWARLAAGDTPSDPDTPTSPPGAAGPPPGPALGIILAAPTGAFTPQITDADFPHDSQIRKPTLICFDRKPNLPDLFAKWNRLLVSLRKELTVVERRLREDRELRAVSIAAVAPMPLLIALGHHLGDQIPGEALLKLRELPWGWQPPAPTDVPLSLTGPDTTEGSLALLINLSGRNRVDQLPTSHGPWRCWEISVPEPDPVAVRSRAQRLEFLALARRAFAQMSQAAAPGQPIHVFPAMPAALAVELGRLYLKKAWPELHIWDRQGSTWRGPLALS